ncbi:MAG: TonB-dependent receptor [Bryobacteraceae bacterium]
MQAQTPPDPARSELPPVKTSITVVEQIAAEVPATITVLGRQEIQEQPGINLDDRLRSLPGFSLFRRSSSLVANPTTQGISLRGLGSSGASRTLVLWDGIPINDPFGGWVYWTRVAPDELERIEVSRGASTAVFGDRAMSGAIGLFSRPAEHERLTGYYEGGNRNSHSVGAGYSYLWRKFAVSAQTRAFTTDGYYIVPKNRRGTADSMASVRFVAGTTRLDYLGTADRLFIKLDILAEERANGTVLTNNSSSLGTLSMNYSHQFAKDGVSILGYHTREQYHASFSSVSANRNTETITYLQTVPSQATGAAGMWRHSESRWNLLAGGDAQRVSGTSTDHLLPTGLRIGGGSQLQHGVFGQFDVSAGPAKFFLGARHQYTGQDSTFFSPSGGVVVGKGRFRGRASLYRSFRAPTLNELYREFRAGNAVTQANALLRPETLFGAEAGFDFVGESSHVTVTLYRNSIEDLITNVTLSSTPALIVRQRRNAASALTRGLDINAQKNYRNWRAEAGYLYAESRYVTGERIPQVPKHQGSAQLSYDRKATLASVSFRSFAYQFEDDRNTFLLPGYATVQAMVRQRLTKSLSANVAVENILNREFLVGFSPVPLIGSPRLWRVGLRWDGRLR